MMRRPSFAVPLVLLVVTALAVPAARAQSDDEETFVVIKAGRVIALAGDEQTGADVVLADGKVRLVGKDLDYPKSATVIDAKDEVVMPGMIHPRTRWGLSDYSRSGVHGDRSAAGEVFPEQIDFEPLLKAGFTAVCFYPAGTGIPGPGAVYRTAGRDETRALGAAYLRITMSSPGRDKKTLREAVEKARKEIEKVEKARKEWEEKQKKAKEEAAKKKQEESKDGKKPADEKKEGEGEKKDEQKKHDVFTPPKIDPAVTPLVEWIRDKKGTPLLFELARASDLRHLDHVLQTASELPAERLYLSGGYSPDYHHIVEDLGEREMAVLLSPGIGNLPYTETRYNLAGELALAGCRVVLLPLSDSASGLGGFRAGLADLVRAGLPRDEALKAVTLHPAEVLGLEDRLGTVEKGKDADLIFLDGDPADPHARVTRVMILGEIVWEAQERP